MIAASRLFVIMGLFGLVAGTTYIVWAEHAGRPEFAGYVLLDFFFVACVFIGAMLWVASPNNKRRAPAPDTGLPGSAHPTRGARNEQGHLHVIPPTIAPAAYSLAVVLLLGAFVYRDKLHLGGAVGWAAAGLVLFLTATGIWYRATSADARAKIRGYQHEEHRAAVEAARNGDSDDPLGPANYFEQIREALEVGDPDWAAQAYAPDAVYYEPANPPHEGREAIRGYLNDLMKGHRDLRFTVERIGSNGNSAIVEWTWTFRSRDNRRVSGQPGVTVLQVGPDGIVYHRDYL